MDNFDTSVRGDKKKFTDPCGVANKKRTYRNRIKNYTYGMIPNKEKSSACYYIGGCGAKSHNKKKQDNSRHKPKYKVKDCT